MGDQHDPIPWSEIEQAREASATRAAELGISISGPRTRLRDPLKAELLRAAGVPEDRIGPEGERWFITSR